MKAVNIVAFFKRWKNLILKYPCFVFNSLKCVRFMYLLGVCLNIL